MKIRPHKPLLFIPGQLCQIGRKLDKVGAFLGMETAKNQPLAQQALRPLMYAVSRFMDHTYIPLSKSILNNANLPFYSHTGPGEFDTALAMNVHHEPVSRLRNYIESRIGVPLKFFKLWNPNGEAHVTVITPPEYSKALKNHVSIEEMEHISAQHHLQASDLKILGIGHGHAQNADGSIQPELGETFFLIVYSTNLLNIRRHIQKNYLQRGGDPKQFDAENFYPHITIGYTVQDLHESHGVKKDMEHSLDRRFSLVLI